MSELSYYDMNRCLAKELKEHFCDFEKDHSIENFKLIKEIVEAMVGIMELEAGGAMREYFEDEHGYDSKTGEFQNRDWRKPFTVYNAAPRYPMKERDYPDYAYPTMPYGADSYDIMNRKWPDGREDRMNQDDRGSDYGRGDYRSDSSYNRGRSRDSRGRYNEAYGIYNMAHMKDGDMPKKLTEQEKQEWLNSMMNSDGTRGETFSKEECSAIAKKVGAKFDKYSESDFCLALNAVYSDFCEALAKADSKVAENPMTWGYLAMAWLDDDDSYEPEERLARYWKYMVKH